jgi:RNA-splicing ligase RtcB
MILRKGAVDAFSGYLIIPMNMRDGSLLCKGLGNRDWLCSAPHGAGRLMSRKQAFDTLNMDDFAKSMSDVYTTSVCQETIDESPMAYKPMQEIVDTIGDTVEILDVIKPIYNFKAKGR